MRLVSARVQSYRVHKDLSHSFSPGLNLVCGPNESGKSTLVEAIHRALFLGAKGNSEPVKLMESRHGGRPRVSLELDVGGKRVAVTKQFGAGQNGTCTLHVDGRTFQDNEAEETLAGLLAVGEAVSGKQANSLLPTRWAHLWTWQGKSKEQPSTRDQHQALVQRLQEIGGGAVMTSPLDQELLTRFRGLVAETFVKGGAAKAGSPLHHAEQELREQEIRLSACVARASALDQAMQDHETAVRATGDLTEERARIQAELLAAQQAWEQATKLRAQHQDLEQRVQAAQAERTRLGADETLIHEREEEIRKLAAKVQPLRDGEAEAARIHDDAQRRLTQLEGVLAAAVTTEKEARDRLQGLRALELLAGREKALGELRQVEDMVRAETENLTRARQALAGLPEVDDKALRKLEKVDREYADAQTQLKAAAASVTLTSSTVEVTLAGTPLLPGQDVLVTDAAEIVVGQVARVRVNPGGAGSLADLRARVTDAARKREVALSALGTRTLEEAREVHARRATLATDVEVIQGKLQALHADTLAERLAEAMGQHRAAQERVEALAPPSQPGLGPRGHEAAAHALGQAEEAFTQADNTLGSALGAAQIGREQVKAAADALQQRRRELADVEDALGQARAKLAALEEARGTQEARAAALAAVDGKLAEVKEQQARVQAELERLGADHLGPTVDRLGRARDVADQKLREAEVLKAGALLRMGLEGTTDPRADVAVARARAERARLRAQELRRDAEATRLLADLLEEEQATVSDRLNAPLANAASAYLACLFGADAKVQLQLEQDGLSGLRVRRLGAGLGDFDFDRLSDGTKEQVAVAVRLAVAEILAGGHGGCLPVVLDDAFVNADPDRERALMGMLDLAAHKGLQLIVLTCNGRGYSGLGVQELALRPPRFDDAPAPPAQETPPPRP
jgi:DNA repair exonuclease SbcCD ATPase subunit